MDLNMKKPTGTANLANFRFSKCAYQRVKIIIQLLINQII